jgi:hypothetical protein
MYVRSLPAGLVGTGLVLLIAAACPAAAPPRARSLEHLAERCCPGQFAAARHEPETLVTRVYPVADLVVPLCGAADQKAPKTQEDCLIGIITSTVRPQSWAAAGGEGSIDYFPLGLALVIRHSPEVHEKVAEVLDALRRLQDVEVAVEVRFLTVSDDCLERLGIRSPVSQGQNGETDGAMRDLARLDDSQVKMVMNAIDGDSHSSVLMAPKLTVFNGQKAVLNLSEKQCFVTGVEMVPEGGKSVPRPLAKNVDTGLVLGMHPVVAPDNKTVTMELEVSLKRADAPRASAAAVDLRTAAGGLAGVPAVLAQPAPRGSAKSFCTRLKLTDGATALLNGWTQYREVRVQTCPPLLCRVPYLNRLFQTLSYGKEREHLLVMVTPRVIVRHEEEEHAPAPVVQRTSATAAAAQRPDLEHPPAYAAQAVPEPAPEAPAPKAQGPAALHVNRRSVRLDYGLENVGPAGVSKIEVWHTRDAQEWTRHEEAVPAKGHATITVASDGLWGFTLVAHSATGMAETPPGKGTQPQVWVEVDTVPPEVRFQEAVRVVNGEGRLEVTYCCEDEHLKEHPVTISCGPSPEGPWTVLGRALEGQGTFTCPVDDLPHECYVRVEAADRAGNVGSKVGGLLRADVKVPRVRGVKVKAEE